MKQCIINFISQNPNNVTYIIISGMVLITIVIILIRVSKYENDFYSKNNIKE